MTTSISSEEDTMLSSMEQNHTPNLNTTASLDDFQTAQQRRVLDTVAEIRKCGLDSFISLPQIVVCGDQSSGKSSVLEALTEIPFPRNDNLCTRYATEIILRRAERSSLSIKIIPDRNRPKAERDRLELFNENMEDFENLPEIMALAANEMGIANELVQNPQASAFSRDVLSITLEGPSAPQLTLVDIPGLIANATMGVTESDVETVAEITDHYISQHRTICLAVISATNDHANQSIVSRIKKYDPHGDRTLGVITKPDRLEAGSASEKGFIALAQNKDVVYKLGWHVLKNRSFTEVNYSLAERNLSEMVWLRRSNFKVLPEDNLGIASLRSRLSALLFEHVKLELPKLRQDLETQLSEYERQLGNLGNPRASSQECRVYLTQLSLEIFEISKAAVDGHYDHLYFLGSTKSSTLKTLSSIPSSRLRALVQGLNIEFSMNFRRCSHKYHFELEKNDCMGKEDEEIPNIDPSFVPLPMSKEKTRQWLTDAIARSRGRELLGHYNPLLIGELFWEQSMKWKSLAEDHIIKVDDVCTLFLKTLISDKCSKDVEYRLWDNLIAESLHERRAEAIRELDRIIKDLREFPISYDNDYTKFIKKRRESPKLGSPPKEHVKDEHSEDGLHILLHVDSHEAAQHNTKGSENYTCEELLDALLSIYKIQQKIFISNVTTQVIERHVVRGLENIFDPIVVNAMSDFQACAVSSEPSSMLNQRRHIEDRIGILKNCHQIFRATMGQVSR